MDINKIASIKSPITNLKIVHTPIKSCFFMLLTEKFPETFSKNKGYFFILEYFAFN